MKEVPYPILLDSRSLLIPRPYSFTCPQCFASLVGVLWLICWKALWITDWGLCFLRNLLMPWHQCPHCSLCGCPRQVQFRGKEGELLFLCRLHISLTYMNFLFPFLLWIIPGMCWVWIIYHLHNSFAML